MKTMALLQGALSASLLLGVFACSDSESADDASDGAGGTGATSSSASSSTGSESGGATASSSSGSTGGAGVGGGGAGGGSAGDCDLDAQDCAARGQSCYPTADAAICEPTGNGELLDQCTKNSDCGEGLFCNPDNFMSCVPWCHLAADECTMNTICYDNPNIDLPPGYGYCLPN